MNRIARLGCKRSHPTKIALCPKISSHPTLGGSAKGSAPAVTTFLQAFEPPREDQGQSGGCTAHSASAGVATAFAAKGQALPFVPSPCDTYAPTRALERAAQTPPGQWLPSLTDSGAELADVITIYATVGVAPMRGPTPDGRNSDVWTDADTGGNPPGNVNDEPAVLELEKAATKLVAGPYVIPVDANASDTCAAAISAGYPIYVGFFCDSAFQAWNAGDAPIGPPNQSDPNGGGHAVFLDGYTTNPDGSRTWRLVNSWGTSWGDDGTCLVSDAWLGQVWELWILDVSLKGGA